MTRNPHADECLLLGLTQLADTRIDSRQRDYLNTMLVPSNALSAFSTTSSTIRKWKPAAWS